MKNFPLLCFPQPAQSQRGKTRSQENERGRLWNRAASATTGSSAPLSDFAEHGDTVEVVRRTRTDRLKESAARDVESIEVAAGEIP